MTKRRYRVLALALAWCMLTQLLPALALSEGAGSAQDTFAAPSYHTARFRAEGAEDVVLFVRRGSAIGALPEAPGREGMVFVGWYDGDTRVTGETVITGDRTFRAVYAETDPDLNRRREQAAYLYTDAGDYADLAVYGGSPNGQPPKVSRNSQVKGDSLRTVLEAWTVTGMRAGMDLVAEVIVTALPELGEAESLALYTVRGGRLNALAADGLTIGSWAACSLTHQGDTGLALVKVFDPSLLAVDGVLVNAAGDAQLSLFGRMPAGTVAEAKAVPALIDGEPALAAYDIRLFASKEQQLKGRLWQPAQPIRVTFRDEALGNRRLDVYHIDGGTEYLTTVTAVDGWVSFSAASFSVYAVKESLVTTVETGDGRTYRITVTYDRSAGIPEGAGLSARELIGSSVADYLTRSALAMEVGGFAYGRVFDISILDAEGAEVQPASPVEVSVTMLDLTDNREDFSVLHFGGAEETPEVLDTVTSGNQVTFSASSFSAYVIVEGPEAIPLGYEKVTTVSDVAALGAEGLFISHKNGFFMGQNQVDTSDGRKGIEKIKPAHTYPPASAERYYFEPVDGTTDQFYVYRKAGDTKKYLKITGNGTTLNSLTFASGESDRTPFKVEAAGDYMRLSYNSWYVNQQGGDNGSRFCAYTGATDANAQLYLWHRLTVEQDPYGLDGKTVALMNWPGGVAARALMAEAGGDGCLGVKGLIVMTQMGHPDQHMFTPEEGDVSFWHFTWLEEDLYTVQAEDGRYLKITSQGVSLSDTPDSSCRIQVQPGSGSLAGKICLKAGGESLTYTGDQSNGFGISGTAGNEWLYMMEESELTSDYYRIYSATEASSFTPQNGDQIIIYCRVWNEETGSYDFYAIDHDGSLVPCYESGDQLQWVGKQLNNMLWQFVEYLDGDGNPTYYYDLKNPYSGSFIAPQTSTGQTLSPDPLGINLNGRRSGAYYTTLVGWDDTKYAYACLKADPNAVDPETGKRGRIVTIPYSQAGLTPDAVDFAFALVQPLPVDDDLETVGTVDHEQYGITMRMIDFPSRNFMKDYLGDDSGGMVTTLVQGLLSTDLGPDGYPTCTLTDRSFADFFAGGGSNPNSPQQVNHLFLNSVYRSSGYFLFDSTQNFATLERDGNFKVYRELASYDPTNTRRNTLMHGQFFPFNDILPGVFTAINTTNEYSAVATVLPDSDPRKHEQLYLLTHRTWETGTGANTQFGMELSADFVQTPDGKDEWGHDIIYEFTGDDDFWLYVDGELVIDLGGIHSAVPGSVNYRTGEVHVNGVDTTLKDLFYQNCLKRGESPEDAQAYVDRYFVLNSEGNWVFKDGSRHTMRIFYLERGAGASNLKMRFNLSSVRPGTVLLNKELIYLNSTEQAAVEFPYQIYYSLDPESEDQAELLANEGTTARVLYKDTGTPVRFEPVINIAGRTYENVYFLSPHRPAEIDFNGVRQAAEDVYYKIVECATDVRVYDPVLIDGEEAEGTAYGGTDPYRQDFPTTWGLTKVRANVNYTNTVKTQPTMTIVKRLFMPDRETELFGYEDEGGDDTIFNFRVYLGPEYENPEATYMYSYFVKNLDGEYCYFDESAQRFTSVGKSDFSLLTPADLEIVTFHSGIWGSYTKIPASYEIEIRSVLPGNKFVVEERPGELADGYTLWEYRVGIGDEEPSPWVPIAGENGHLPQGSIQQEDVHVEVRNYKGFGLRMYKTWSDADYMEDRDPTCYAVFCRDSQDQLNLVPGSIRVLPYTARADGQTLYWYFQHLPVTGTGLEDYVVMEVTLEAPVTLDPDDSSVVTSCGGYTVVAQYASIELSGLPKGSDEQTVFPYTVIYEDPDYDDNLGVFRISNERRGIKIYKEDWEGQPKGGAAFTLVDSEGHTISPAGGFVSDATTGLITEAFLRAGMTYTLTETGTPAGFRGLLGPLTISLTGAELTVTGAADDSGWYEVRANANDLPDLVIKNRPYTLQAVKIDESTEQPVAGAHFALYKKHQTGSIIAFPTEPEPGYTDLVTGTDGLIPKITEALGPGEYRLQETSPAPGYQPLPSHTYFNIDAAGQVTLGEHPDCVTLDADDSGVPIAYTLTVRNKSKASLTILKQVTGDFSDETNEFTFTLLSVADEPTGGTDYPWVKTAADGTVTEGSVSTAAGSNTFTLRHNDRIVITLPVGKEIRIREDDGQDGIYRKTWTVGTTPGEASPTGAVSGDTLTITLTENTGRTITNHLDPVSPTGYHATAAPYLLLLLSGLLLLLPGRRRKGGGAGA